MRTEGRALASGPFSWMVRAVLRETSMSLRRVAAVAALVTLPVTAAYADEGMWTFDAFPAAKMRAANGWAPDQVWLDRVRAAAVRLTGGCSASFVSADGLIL